MSFMGCGELECPTGVIVASFVDHGYEINIYHLLQCWNGFWDLLWLENGNQDSVLKRSALWEDQLLIFCECILFNAMGNTGAMKIQRRKFK